MDRSTVAWKSNVSASTRAELKLVNLVDVVPAADVVAVGIGAYEGAAGDALAGSGREKREVDAGRVAQARGVEARYVDVEREVDAREGHHASLVLRWTCRPVVAVLPVRGPCDANPILRAGDVIELLRGIVVFAPVCDAGNQIDRLAGGTH